MVLFDVALCCWHGVGSGRIRDTDAVRVRVCETKRGRVDSGSGLALGSQDPRGARGALRVRRVRRPVNLIRLAPA